MLIFLFTIESGYNFAFINFISGIEEINNCLFIFRHAPTGKYIYPKSISSRIIYADNFFKLITIALPALLKAKWIYIYYLPYGPTLFILALFGRIIRKSSWIIWGGDLHAFERRNENIRAKIYEKLRRHIIKSLPEIDAMVKGDYDLCKSIYQTRADYVEVVTVNPGDYGIYRRLGNIGSKEEISILIGNSGDPANEHTGILDKLSRFKNEKIRIYCVLSYGGTESYISGVIETGENIFKDKFIPIVDYLSTQEYAEFLSGMDIAIMNHNRQQGLGNIIPLLIMKKKVFLRSNVASFQYFLNKKCTLFDTLKIDEMDFNTLINKDVAVLNKNAEIMNQITSDDNLENIWKDLFKRHK